LTLAALIACWIDKKRETPYKFKDIPFKFKLNYRANQEGFEINKFHENCDNKGPTVVIIKVRNSDEIIGGYNPLEWRSFKIVEDERSPLLFIIMIFTIIISVNLYIFVDKSNIK
jgi:hypothetical protein